MSEQMRRTHYPAASKSKTILSIGRQYADFTPAKSWEQNEHALDVARKMTDTLPPALSTLAIPASKVETTIRQYAKVRSEHLALIEAAEAAAGYAHDSLEVECNNAVRELVGMIAAEFEHALERFRESLHAPEQLGGYEDPEQIALFQLRLRAASDLLVHFSNRISIGQAIGESSITNSVGIWLMLDAPAEDANPELLQTYGYVVASASDLHEMPSVARFRLLLDRGMPLSIAPIGGAMSRQDTWETLRRNALSQALLTPFGEQQRREALGFPSSLAGAS